MSQPLILPELISFFEPRGSTSIAMPNEAMAVVALVFHHDPRTDDLNLCIAQRAVVEGDPWSGDMALPGGKPEDIDGSLHDVANRETFEEVGIHLPKTSLIGDLGRLLANRGGLGDPLPVYPMIYTLDDTPPEFQFDHEIVAAHWVSMGHIWNEDNWSTLEYSRTGQSYPGFKLGDQLVWGFTLRVISVLAQTLGKPLPVKF